ncbi:MAG: hypothetical protein ACP5O4_08375, partial [bacterium]
MRKIKLAKIIAGLALIATVPSYAGTVVSGSANNNNNNNTNTNTNNKTGNNTSNDTSGCKHGYVKFEYTGDPQYFTITPEIEACGYLYFTLVGGGGGGPYGGSGGLTTGVIPVSALSAKTLTVIVGGGGGFYDKGFFTVS